MKENFARYVSAEGMVLLENNENVLPLKKDDTIAFVGKGIFEYHKGGLGSADVFSKYVVNIVDGMKEKDISLLESSFEKKEEYSLDILNEYAKKSNIALVGISRLSSEGGDREISDYYLSKEESALFDNLDNSDFENVVVVLNIGSLIDVASVKKHKKVKSILIVWQPGMDGGNAVADILCGDVTPCGKLTDTIAFDYYDYPSANHFDESDDYVYYCEDIFVGYRYFETFAKEKVLYPFGYGLSYTNFKKEIVSFSANEEKITAEIKVTNIGNCKGKDVVQMYFSSPKGEVLKSAIELCAYKKTNDISPNESEIVKIEFKTNDMAYFNEKTAAYTLDKGEYNIYIGSDARNLTLCGTYTVKENKITEQCTLKFTKGLPYRINSEGKFEETNIFNIAKDNGNKKDEPNLDSEKAETKQYTLYDVEEGKISLSEFISTLSDDQLIDTAQGQPPAFPRGTAGIGNLPKLGIANPQTADGPAGVRRSKPTTCFPCATLLACTWNEEILEQIGAVMGEECIENGVDILLAPGLNIHRNPLCGRNFEYYSEDPLISGKTASAIVKGIQSKGIGATIKHFAFNNREKNRGHCSSEISERAVREIYLKGFEIAVKESQPWCLMTSYNKINGTHTSASYNLISGVLRGEWGYDGMVMTDWLVDSHLWEEILAGNNVKMPFASEEIAKAKDFFKYKTNSRTILEKNAYYILKLVMKTRRFKEKNFGTLHKVDSSVIKATDFTEVSHMLAGSSIFADNEEYLHGIGLQWGNPAFITYRICSDNGGKYRINMKLSCAYEGISIGLNIDGNNACEIPVEVPEYNLEKPFTIQYDGIELEKGEHEMKLFINGSKDSESIYLSKIFFEKL